MATASKTPKSTTPRKRTPKASAATTAAAPTDAGAEAISVKPKPATKPRAKRAPRSAAPTARARKRSALGKAGLAAIAATGLGALGALAFGLLRNRRAGVDELGTVPTDLQGDSHPDGSQRAIEAFRPDPTAPVPLEERDAFRPAFAGGSAPTLVAGQADALRRVDAAPS